MKGPRKLNKNLHIFYEVLARIKATAPPFSPLIEI